MSTTGAETPLRARRGVALRITPLALLGGRHAVRVLERNILVYRRSWIFIVSGFFEPLFYLLSIGVGLSHLVGPIPVDGRTVAYTAFVAPGLLAASAMNGAMLDSTFLVFMKLKIAKTYDAMLATPLAVGDIALGELSWCVLRGALYSGAFLCIMTLLGYDHSPGSSCAGPAPSSSPWPSPPSAWPGPPSCAPGRTSTSFRWPSSPSFCSRPPSIPSPCSRGGCRPWCDAHPSTKGCTSHGLQPPGNTVGGRGG